MTRSLLVALLLVSSPRALAQDRASESQAAPPPPGRFFAHVNSAFNVYSYLGSTERAGSMSMTPGDRAILFQFFGAGYWLTPSLRVQLSFQLAETVSGLPPGASALTTFAIIPWAVWTPGRFFAGAGPDLAPRSYGKNDFDAGLFTCFGYGVPLGHGFTLAGAVQTAIMFDQRFALAVNPALSLGYRF